MAPSHYVLLLFIITLKLSATSAFPTSPLSAEVVALLKWKDSLQISANLSSWNITSPGGQQHQNTSKSSSHCTSWYGVSCDKAGRIVGLNLSEISLSGTLHHFPFTFLPNLVHLDLSLNALFGTLPAPIGNFSQLRYLDLSYNQLTGDIPPQIGMLTNLQILHLFQTNINGSIPISIGNLTKLSELGLHMNLLTGSIPSSILYWAWWLQY